MPTLVSESACLGLVFFLQTSLGLRVLEFLRLPCGRRSEEILFAGAVGFGMAAQVVFLSGLAQALSWGLALWCVVCLAWGRHRRLWYHLMGLLRDAFHLWAGEGRLFRLGAGLLLAVSALALLLTTAPLTGSDAMAYHFVVPKLYAQADAIQPIPWLVHSYFVGYGHMLILLGFLLQGESLALGICLLGGLLALLATYRMARHLLAPSPALLVLLLFVTAPMTFWHLAVAGNPDLWTTFYTSAALLAFLRWREESHAGWLLISGLLAGLAAGCKYPAWSVPLLLGVLLLGSCSRRRAFRIFLPAVLLTGFLRPVVNFSWTGDPFFPFLTPLLNPQEVNEAAYRGTLIDTRAPGFDLSLEGLLRYPMRVFLEGEQFGVGHYFGPAVLCFLPLLIFYGWRFSSRPYFLFTLGFLLCNALSSQMGRFLLPVFPILLILAVYGWMRSRPLRLIHGAGALVLFLSLAFTTSASLLYAAGFVPVALGWEPPETFLKRKAADYEMADLLNRSIPAREGRVLIFFRHTYYLEVPYLGGQPGTSWEVDPGRLQGGEALLEFFREWDVRWVLQSGPFPSSLGPHLKKLIEGQLLELSARASARTFTGWRVYGKRQEVPLRLFRLREDLLEPQWALREGRP